MFSLIFLSSFSGLVPFVAVANTFEDPFYSDRDYSAKLDGTEIADDEDVEEAFEVVVEVSEGVIIKLCVKTAIRVADSFI